MRRLTLSCTWVSCPEAAMAAHTRHRGSRNLALADRACLATAMIRRCTVVTADRAWSALDLGVNVGID